MESDNPPAVIISLHPDPDSTEAVQFFRRLGLCISTWAFIDRRLYQIYHHATGAEIKQSAAAFYKDRSFKNRLRLVDSAVKEAWKQDEYSAEWRPLHDQAKGLAYTRNILAHHPAKRLGTSRRGQALDVYSVHIEPYEKILGKEYLGLPEKGELTIDDLKDHETKALNLESKLHDFAWRIGGWRASQKSRA